MNTEESLKDKIIKLRLSGKTYLEICNELNCVKSTVSYHCKNANLDNSNSIKSPTNEEIDKMQKYYDDCNSSIKTSKKFGWSKFTVLKYIKTKKRKLLTEKEKKQKNIDGSLNNRRKLKERLVEYKGGKCEICGYDRCVKAMDFHHKNPKEKEFPLTYMNRKWEILIKEADKCILVCANCHREIHAGFIDINEIV
jgi:hypothetical protein